MGGTASRFQSIVLTETWRRYKRTGDREARNQLVLAYSPMVKYLSGRIASRMPNHIEIADLVSYGLGGLIEAVERFEPERGIGFESYASTRIRGAIFDELRSLDWVPRTVRREARRIEEATADLSSRLHRMPTDDELANQMSIEPEELDASLQRVADARMVALDQPWNTRGADGLETTLLHTLPDSEAADPAASADRADLRGRIRDAILHLPEREQLVLGLRYHQEMRLSEIGEILGVTESRVSQLHAKAVLQVRALLPDELEPAVNRLV
ncbi:MAG TPA: FliA/WhiG family RNA polymerase sigma factor [Thermoleophilaceae bacterium]|nr:FliA/WhiG family RNA polymerase sigma factor [Thermoleophilaceae bacterium]